MCEWKLNGGVGFSAVLDVFFASFMRRLCIELPASSRRKEFIFLFCVLVSSVILWLRGSCLMREGGGSWSKMR